MGTRILLLFTFFFSLCFANAQTGRISGTVKVDKQLQEGVQISLSTNPERAVTSSEDGHFSFEGVPFGIYELRVAFPAYQPQSQTFKISEANKEIALHLQLNDMLNTLNEIVITGTKTFKRQTNSPVIVNLISAKTLDNVQACNLAEGLKFQPGLRVETDCQTCNYTQLRMNGLAGGYSQILINGRPIFSPLTGLYGLEQLPTNMIERIEVVRGGGSSLYGSSAIGGTVNVITKTPEKNSYELNSVFQNINGRTNDHILSGNTSIVSESKNMGASFFFNQRNRQHYDHNADNFSEIPKVENTSFGTNLFFIPKENQKLEISISKLNEYRFGGEITDKPAYLAQQSEERTHDVWMGSADYQINFNKERSSFITYAAWQNTKRKHYTGILPSDSAELQAHIQQPPYGSSLTTTLQGGFQLNHRVNHFLGGKNTFTLGSEYVIDKVFDEIPTYRYTIDQQTADFGLFAQSDWDILPSLTLLSGLRMDKHNLVDNLVLSPRLSLLYKYKSNTQIRLSYGTGFRAPQAFDTDMHIAFAAGGVSRVSLSPLLQPERSQSLSTSINYDKASELIVAGFTFEAFFTKLHRAFFLQPMGYDNFGALFQKQNGQAATVKGVTLELRANYNKKIQLETGFTLQSSQYENEVVYIDGLPGLRNFVRTPSDYGFATLSFTPGKRFSANLNYLYTGTMKVPHFAGAPNQAIDEIATTPSFSELSLKLAYRFLLAPLQSNIEIYGGIKNLGNAYQSSFDIGKNRDSNYIFGPSQPRTFFVGIKLGSS